MLISSASTNVSNAIFKHIDLSLRQRSKGHEAVASVCTGKDGTLMMQEEDYFEPPLADGDYDPNGMLEDESDASTFV